jgi:hypothetical protein
LKEKETMEKKIGRRTAIQAGVGAAFAAAVSGALPYETFAKTASPSGTVTGSATAKKIMPLAHALRSRSLTLVKAQNDYKTSVATVSKAMHCISSSSNLPTLNTNPPDWSAFQAAYQQAQKTANDWAEHVMARLLEVPGDVQNLSTNTIVTDCLQDASLQASTLITQPTDPTALAVLKKDLKMLSSQFNSVTTFISGAISQIRDFKDTLPGVANQLQILAQRSVADANVDQQQIAQLTAAVAQLQSDIDSLNSDIAGLATAEMIAIADADALSSWPFGSVAWFFVAAIIVVDDIYIGLDNDKIVADKAAIQQKQQQMDNLTADVSALVLLTKNYARMANLTVQVENTLQTVLDEWQTLEDDVNNAITDIQTALSDTTANNFQAVTNDLNLALTEWKAAYSQAGNLNIKVEVNTAPLQLGMSASAVQAAAATGQTIDIIDYYNNETAVA